MVYDPLPSKYRSGLKQRKAILVVNVLRRAAISMVGIFVILVLLFLVTGGDWESLMTDPRYLKLLGFMALVGGGYAFWDSFKKNK